MEFCPNCGDHVDSSLSYCPNCGINLKRVKPPAHEGVSTKVSARERGSELEDAVEAIFGAKTTTFK
jgi:uncharacterized membrane protein YvbJ